jgi:CheY-like chemotaxis protein
MGASFSGKKADDTHLPLSALTNDALTEELPTSNPNKNLTAILSKKINHLMIQSANFPIFFVLCKKIIKKKFFFAFFCLQLKYFLYLCTSESIRLTKIISYMKKKILILDDKETIAKVLSIYLMSDYEVQWLPDGLQGMKWLQAGNTPDLIISDIRMPGMRGDDFLEWIKQNELFRHIPVIMLSSEDSTSERIRLLEIGAEDYIVKPFNPMELKIRVKKILPN